MSGFKKSGRVAANSTSKDGLTDVVADGITSLEEDDKKALETMTFDSESTVDFIESLNIEDMRKMSKDEKKALFFKSGGRMKLDTKAIYDMRERSMILCFFQIAIFSYLIGTTMTVLPRNMER